jgi:hypothetical protein
MRRLAFFFVVSLVALTTCDDLPPQEAPPVPAAAAAAAAATITGADVLARIGVMADDSMRGRDTPSSELDEVAEWIASELGRMGVRPGVGGEYVQRYPVRVGRTAAQGSSARIGGDSLAWGEDVLGGAAVEGAWGGSLAILTGRGALPDGLPGLVGGRHVIVLGEPDGGGRRRGAARALLGAGAVAVWQSDGGDAGAWEEARASALEARTLRQDAEAGPGVLLVREASLRRALTSAGLDVDALRAAGDEAVAIEPVDVPASVTLALQVTEDASAPNVVGILEGSDPTLRGEYVLYSAHMDHVGVGTPDATGDSIFNGADDDASGTAVVLEVAEAMASLPRAPRRSVVFLLVSGEEKGLWGSSWYAANPTVPLDQVVADLNADMVGRNWPDTIVAIGKEHSDLGATLERVNAAHPEIGMTAIDDLWPEENFYGRSDHYNFARAGVPILFFFNGTHEDYHRPSDEVERIDADKAARIGRLLLHLGIEVADAQARPIWNPDSYREIVEGG